MIQPVYIKFLPISEGLSRIIPEKAVFWVNFGQKTGFLGLWAPIVSIFYIKNLIYVMAGYCSLIIPSFMPYRIIFFLLSPSTPYWVTLGYIRPQLGDCPFRTLRNPKTKKKYFWLWSQIIFLSFAKKIKLKAHLN